MRSGLRLLWDDELFGEDLLRQELGRLAAQDRLPRGGGERVPRARARQLRRRPSGGPAERDVDVELDERDQHHRHRHRSLQQPRRRHHQHRHRHHHRRHRRHHQRRRGRQSEGGPTTPRQVDRREERRGHDEAAEVHRR